MSGREKGDFLLCALRSNVGLDMATAPTKAHPAEDSDFWTAPKLIGLGLVTLAIAFTILHILSGTDCIPGFC